MSKICWIDKINDKGNNSQTYSKEFHLLLNVFGAGSISAIVCTFLLQPLDVMKTRLQTPQFTPIKGGRTRFGMLNILLHIKKHEDIRMLWAGTVPTLIRGIPGGGIYFVTYDWIKDTFFPHKNITSIQSVEIGMLSRSITDMAVIPLTVIKTRMESGFFKYKGVYSGIKQIYVHEGWRGLTSGLLPVLARDIPLSGMYVMCYIQSVELVPYDLREIHPYTVHSTCAAFASVSSSIFTHPPDVIKTQMQLFPEKYKGVMSVVTDIWIQYGLVGFFQGIVPRLIKRTVCGVISWTLYEKVKADYPK